MVTLLCTLIFFNDRVGQTYVESCQPTFPLDDHLQTRIKSIIDGKIYEALSYGNRLISHNVCVLSHMTPC